MSDIYLPNRLCDDRPFAGMAERWSNDQAVQWFAHLEHRATPFCARMEHFVRDHIDASRASAVPRTSRMRLWMHETLEWFDGKPAKSREFIRRILERIHALVRGDTQ